MEQITSMKITGITLSNFRNHTETKHFELGDLSYITGHNGVGKTTIAHAVCYALYGVSFYGEQKIERLMNDKSDNVQVQLYFTDQNGVSHTLIRTRNNDKCSLLYDGYTIQQGMIERMFPDKNTFIAMFNPTYLAENMGNDGRELILRYLPSISQSDVIESLPQYRTILQNIDLETQSPEQILKNTRSTIRQIEQQTNVLQGHIESIEEARKTSEQKLSELYAQKQTVEGQIAVLKAKQFDGINTEEFAIQKDMLARKMEMSSGKNSAIAIIKEKLAQAKERVYISKFTDTLAEIQAEYNALGNQYCDMAQRIRDIKVGDTCPTCMMQVTDANLEEFRSHLKAEFNRIGAAGRSVAGRREEITELDRQAKETFEKFKADDIASLTAELEKLTDDTEIVDSAQIRCQLEKLAKLEKYGGLTDEEYSQLSELETSLIGIKAQIEAVELSSSDEKLKAALVEKDVFDEQKRKYSNTVSALTEYIFKRAELAAADLDMPNVKIRLFDVVRSTGEVKSAFKFEYKGREYMTLSLSEKMLVGIEISAMMRKITGRDYPICIDNTESIAAFNNVDMPSQVMLIRVVKGQPLTIKFQNNMQTASGGNEMRKAA